MPGTGGHTIPISNITRENSIDEYLFKRLDSTIMKEKRSTEICDCVWSNDFCFKCSVYDSFKCSYCPMVFLKSNEYNRHLRISHRNELLNYCMHWIFENSVKRKENDQDKIRNINKTAHYQCNNCSLRFLDKVHLIEHLSKHMKKNDNKIENSILKSRIRRSVEKMQIQNQYHCDRCSKFFYTKASLKKHIFIVHDDMFSNINDKNNTIAFHTKIHSTNDKSNKLIKKSFKNNDQKCIKNGYYTCDVCSQIFLKRHSFTRHVNLHTSNRYDCDECKKTFTSEQVLNTHKIRKHKELPKNVFYLNGRKYLKCDLCSFTCRNEKNKMEEHMRVHTGEKPFTCELCGKQFRTKALLRVHRRFVHEGIKEHACDICGRCFSNKRYTEEHRRIHTGEKPLICDLCGKTFRQSSSLSKHVENHMGIKKHGCHLCGKRFSNTHHLRIHIKRHMGENNHICTFCGKGFVDQYQLKNHNVVHSEERPFVCGVCGMGFKLLKHLKQHGKTHRST